MFNLTVKNFKIHTLSTVTPNKELIGIDVPVGFYRSNDVSIVVPFDIKSEELKVAWDLAMEQAEEFKFLREFQMLKDSGFDESTILEAWRNDIFVKACWDLFSNDKELYNHYEIEHLGRKIVDNAGLFQTSAILEFNHDRRMAFRTLFFGDSVGLYDSERLAQWAAR